MRRLVIAVDCDDVLLDSTAFIVGKYNEQYGAAVTLQEAHTPGNPDWGAERDEVYRRIDAIQLSREYGALAPTDEVITGVRELAAHHELHLVTARSEAVMSVTKRMIEQYFPGCFTSIEHVGQLRAKSEICCAINADVLIDDNIKHLHDAAENGIDHLLWFGNYPWQVALEAPIGVARCRDWQEAQQEIQRLAGE